MPVNTTNIADSTYYSLWLYRLDTMDGFHEFLQDSSVIRKLDEQMKWLHQSVPMTSETGFGSDLFYRLWVKEYFLSMHRNRIRLRQKGAVWKCARKDGTKSTDWLSLREDKTFDIHAMSWMRDTLYEGTYTRSSDTIRLNFMTEKPVYAIDTYILSEKYLSAVGETKPRESNKTFFVRKYAKPK